MSTTRKFTKQELYDMDLPNSPGDAEGCKVISDKIVGTRRWSTDYELIFQLSDQPEDEAWMVRYSVGSTEQQDERPWEYKEEVTAYLVRKRQKVVEVWE